jgi:hypothetical protein
MTNSTLNTNTNTNMAVSTTTVAAATETITKSTFPPPPPFYKLYEVSHAKAADTHADGQGGSTCLTNLELLTPPTAPTGTYSTFRELHQDSPFTHPISHIVHTILTTSTAEEAQRLINEHKSNQETGNTNSTLKDDVPSNEFIAQLNIPVTLRRILRQLMQIYIELLHLLMQAAPTSTSAIIEAKVQLLSGHFLALTYLLTYLRPHQARISLGCILQQQYRRTVQKREHYESLIERCRDFLSKHQVDLID